MYRLCYGGGWQAQRANLYDPAGGGHEGTDTVRRVRSAVRQAVKNVQAGKGTYAYETI